ncbi:het domain-containing protein [Fusarium heterosporum]|uniref:Het domain-containing protein n=1 Tax=Fusarium heterosporum TaxID=42747 RepID=A0A8H5TK19_FUSHE|nr:het domain-containing protein [Fusarium heterosporum]
MRLLNTKKVFIIETHGIETPPYAILSHTWSTEEIVLKDVQNSSAYGGPWPDADEESFYSLGVSKNKGFTKILQSVTLAANEGHRHIWIDTCCIDKTSSAELSEAINSMYQWYAKAEICYAYLADVTSAGTEELSAPNSSFRQSRWFTRGWTLQELIASREVLFYASDWSYLGSKNGDIEFTQLLSEITGIQLDVLTGELSPQEVSLASRMHWAAHRQTTRLEDIAYCLLGIFDVNIPLLYGEGKRSFIRLQEAILNKDDDQSLFAWHLESVVEKPKDQPLHTDNAGGFSGLLADSPARFWDNSEMETASPLTLTSSPPTITSKGLGLDFLLLSCKDDDVAGEADYKVLLNCERTKDGRREAPVIFLKRTWGMGDQFARVRPDLKKFLSPNVKLFEEATYERIFVKHDPSSDTKTIRVMPTSSDSLLVGTYVENVELKSDWVIKDAWPKQAWDGNNRMFQTKELSFGLPCAVLRLEFNSPEDVRTLDVAIGIHASDGQLCRSWCHIIAGNAIFDPQYAFEYAVSQAKTGNITYKDLSKEDMYHRDMATWALVTERNRRRGVDITLHVLSPPDWKEPESNLKSQRTQYGEIIPLSTLSDTELKAIEFDKYLPFPQHLLDSGPKRVCQTYPDEVSNAMRSFTVADCIDISDIGVSMDSIKDYCLKVLPTADTKMQMAVQFLLENKKAHNIESSDALGILKRAADSFLRFSPIQWAIISADEDMLQSLIEAKEDPAENFKGNVTSFHLIMLWDSEALIHMLEYPDFVVGSLEGEPIGSTGDYPLHFAAAYTTSTKIWENILDYFPIVMMDRQNNFGETALHRACAMGNTAAMESLWRYRAQMDQTDNYGRTPLWHAACSDYQGMVTEKLRIAGASLVLPDLDGLSPIHVSCRQGTVGCTKQLISAGVSPNLPAGVLGLLPMHFAATFGHTVCVQALLEAGAKIVTDVDGPAINALHIAIANGKDSCARAIWNSMDEKPKFRGWSPCILFETQGPVLNWMHVEVNDEYWFAIDDPLKEGGTKGFLCSSPENETPKLWVDPFVDIPS